MLTANDEQQQVAEIKQALRATWTHTTFIVDKEIFENAGYDVSELTKDDLDELADAMKDFWIGSKEWDRAIEYAARGVLEQKQSPGESEADK